MRSKRIFPHWRLSTFRSWRPIPSYRAGSQKRTFAREISLMRRYSEAAHRRGMRVVGYCPGLEFLSPHARHGRPSMYQGHPDWVQRGLDGRPNVFLGGRRGARARVQSAPQLTRGVAPASTLAIQPESMFWPVKITAARRPSSRLPSCMSAARAAAPAPSAQLCVSM
jgi:hypothetical protein